MYIITILNLLAVYLLVLFSDDIVLVLAQEDDTTVTMSRFNVPVSIRNINRAASTEWEVPSNQLCYLEADKWVLLSLLSSAVNCCAIVYFGLKIS